MKLLSLKEFQQSLRYAKLDWLHQALDSPEMAQASEEIYAKGAKTLNEFHKEHQKAWGILILLVDKLDADYPYLDVAPLQKAAAYTMKDSAGEFQFAIQHLKRAKHPRNKTAGVLSWLSGFHPGILAIKAVVSAAKFIHQKLRTTKDPNAFAAIKSIREALTVLGDSKRKLGDEQGGLYYELKEGLTQALMTLSFMDKATAKWELGESGWMDPVYLIYHLGEHTSYVGAKVGKALYALEVQAKSGPP